MIFVDLKDFSYGNEIEDLARVFYPNQRVETLRDTSKVADGDYILRCKYQRDESSREYVISQLETLSGLVKENRLELESRQGLDERDYHRLLKNAFKACVYDLFTTLTGKAPKWGILTGIRPVKLVNQFRKDGMLNTGIERVLLDSYRIDPSKARLLQRIADVQGPYLEREDGSRASLYIHIPFCSSRCHYCSFPSGLISRVSDKMDAYLDCLDLELSRTIDLFKARGIIIDTVYIGGGTPTVLDQQALERLLGIIDLALEKLGKKHLLEYTVEAGRPDSLDRAKLLLLKNYGVNRISINPQTMNQKTLDLIGRNHTVEDIINIYHEARQVGFESINMDLILGLPGEDANDFAHTMDQIGPLMPDNITMHTLAVKRGSSYKEDFEQYDPDRGGIAERMAEICTDWVDRLGMVPYYLYRQKYMLDHLENVGYSLPGKECLYNIQIMEEKRSIWAFGAGAISKVYYKDQDRLERVANVKNLDDYLDRIDEMIERKTRVLL